MAGPVYPGFLGSPRLLSGSGGGSPLTSTPIHIAIPAGVKNVQITARDFSTAIVVSLALNPFLSIIKTVDGMRFPPFFYSEQAQDGDTGTEVELSDLPEFDDGGAIYIGSAIPFSGISVDVADANDGGGTMSVDYYDGEGWEDISAVDTTSNFANDGTVTWTVPADWKKESLPVALNLLNVHPSIDQTLYWVRITTSDPFGNDTNLSSVYSINQYANTNEFVEGQVYQEYITRNINGGNLQASCDAGTASLIVNGWE